MRAYFIGYNNRPTANIVSCSWLFRRIPWLFFYRNEEEVHLRRTNVIGVNVTFEASLQRPWARQRCSLQWTIEFILGGGSNQADKRRCLKQQPWHSVTNFAATVRVARIQYKARLPCEVSHGSPHGSWYAHGKKRTAAKVTARPRAAWRFAGRTTQYHRAGLRLQSHLQRFQAVLAFHLLLGRSSVGLKPR